jgi:DNA-binding PadR family transcriptional regulator
MIGKGHIYQGNRISPLQFTMLVLLRKRPMYGYEVLKRLRELFEGVWTPQTGSIYPSLKRLEEHGLIVSEKREGKDYYSISPEGERWLTEVVQSVPFDIQFFSRYLKVVAEAVSDIRERSVPTSGRDQFSFHSVFEKDEVPPEERMERLRWAKKGLTEKLAEVERELETVENDIKNKGGERQ